MVFYRKAVELKPDFVGAHYNIARLNVELGKTDEAIEAYKSVIEIAPGLGPVYHDLSLLYYDKGQYDLAIKYCDLATSHGYSVPPETHKKLRSYRE